MNQEKYQQSFAAEQPYLEQSQSWREGMRYHYCPERYPLTQSQLQRMQACGELMGQFLDRQFGRYSVIEFRIDYVSDKNGQLFVAEVQTDDRGLPAVANERNARGFSKREPFTGVISPFLKALKLATKKENPLLLVAYPQNEQFYYNGFYDFRKLCFAEQLGPEVVVAPQEIINQQNGTLNIRFSLEGLNLKVKPDLIWDFSNNPLNGPRSIQPQVTKQLLVDIWYADSPLTQDLRDYVPLAITVTPAQISILTDVKNSWVIKPLSEKWSKGVIIGKQIDQYTWAQQLQANIPIIVQRFVDPRLDYFQVMAKNGQFYRQAMYSRVEGYYCANESGWTLADTLITATPTYPVHGQRDSIMTLAQIL